MRRLVDWFFRDRRTGAITVGQWPNLPLWLFAAAALAVWGIEAFALAVPGGLVVGLQLAALVSLAWWAIDEILRGVNPWRRCLGGATLLFVIGSLAWRA